MHITCHKQFMDERTLGYRSKIRKRMLMQPLLRYLCLNVAEGFECSDETRSYVGGSLVTGKVTLAGQVLGEVPH